MRKEKVLKWIDAAVIVAVVAAGARTLSSVALASTIGAAICPGITDAFRMGNCPVAAELPPEIHRVRYVLQEATRVVGVVNLVVAIRLGIRVQDESRHFL